MIIRSFRQAPTGARTIDIGATGAIDQEPSLADIAGVHATFDRLWPRADDAAERFCVLLFEIAPQVSALFHGDLTEQRCKFMSTLAGWSAVSTTKINRCRSQGRWQKLFLDCWNKMCGR
jgi:hypothetical protein